MTDLFPVLIDDDWNIPWCLRSLGEEIPFTDLLDEQPGGWLNSLSYYRNDLPKNNKAIYDCGAWSYRNAYTPPIDSVWAAEQYKEKANPGSMVIAPDHMLIAGEDNEHRQKWNKREAVRFLKKCPSNLKPMGVVHGMRPEDRIDNAQYLIDVGYQHLAVGGVAGLKRGNVFEAVVDITEAIRNAIPTSTHLHVLGRSHPNYFKEWIRVGVNSVDGSFVSQEAIGGKLIFFEDGIQKTYRSATTPGSEEGFLFDVPSVSQAPSCDCRCCYTLKRFGLDPRCCGSKALTQGRLFHNLNMLIKETSRLKVAHDNQ